MIVRAHPNYARFLGAMNRVATSKLRSYAGIIFRSAPPNWAAGKRMIAGLGSMKSGARFNAPDTFPAVYGSTTPELAMIESLAYQRRAGLPPERAMPLMFKAIRVEIERLLDLTTPDVLGDLGVVLTQLKQDPWWLCRARMEESLTQALGRAAHACGVQAIMAASAHTADPMFNVVVLPDHLTSSSVLRVLRSRPRTS